MHSETAPKDGKSVLLDEEDATARSDAAPGKDHLRRGPGFSFFLSGAAAQVPTASDLIAPSAAPVSVAVGAQTTPIEAQRSSQARWRFAATVLAASLFAAAFTGMYFRAQLSYEVAQLRKAADAKATELQQERDHSTALASELATVRRDFDKTAALSSKATDEGAQLRKFADAKAAELQQERDHSTALASELATVRRDFNVTAALSSKATDEVAQLRKVADATATELQQERDQRAALASELATVRRDFDSMTALLSKTGEEAAELRKLADAKAAELQQERGQRAALASELATVRRDFDTMAALLSQAGRKVADAKAAEPKQEPLQSRAPAAGAPVTAPPARKFDPDELATLINRAKILVAAGDISPARLLLERAAEAQEPTAALLLARTYDPDVLRTGNLRNVIPDPAMARIWYQKAAQLGSADAQHRLSELHD